ncbi:MAG: integral membrane protein [Hyphomonadaceae bacterium]|nr:MAG: integral membrane protein [Hyphomonadaceae bacterium]
MDYLIIKWIHILSSTILFGTGIGSAFYMFVANRTKDIASIAFATKWVVIADWFFTTPSIIIQLVSGLYMVHTAGHDWSAIWIKYGIILYFVTGACWLPVVVIQIKMRDMALAALANKLPLDPKYWKMDKWWITLGSLAFPIVVVIFWLMVAKPF